LAAVVAGLPGTLPFARAAVVNAVVDAVDAAAFDAVFDVVLASPRAEPDRRGDGDFFDPLRPDIAATLVDRPAEFFDRADLVRPTRSRARTS
jgi:hypothetical protein